MSKKEIKWGKLNLKGIDEENLNVFNTKHLTAIENGSNWVNNKTKEELDYINEKKSKSHIGLKEDEETKQKKSEALKGRKLTKEHKKNLSLSKIGKKQSDEHIEKKKIIFKGKNNPMYGKNHSTKSIKKMIKNHPSKNLIKCPHCNKEIGANNYSRYHGDNCKLK
jgi:hypothetical protein